MLLNKYGSNSFLPQIIAVKDIIKKPSGEKPEGFKLIRG
jgi:hypothetical protein